MKNDKKVSNLFVDTSSQLQSNLTNFFKNEPLYKYAKQNKNISSNFTDNIIMSANYINNQFNSPDMLSLTRIGSNNKNHSINNICSLKPIGNLTPTKFKTLSNFSSNNILSKKQLYEFSKNKNHYLNKENESKNVFEPDIQSRLSLYSLESNNQNNLQLNKKLSQSLHSFQSTNISLDDLSNSLRSSPLFDCNKIVHKLCNRSQSSTGIYQPTYLEQNTQPQLLSKHCKNHSLTRSLYEPYKELNENKLRNTVNSNLIIDSSSCQQLFFCSNNVRATTLSTSLTSSNILIPKNAKTAGFIVASSIYGQLLVVICLAFFTAELYTSLPLHFFESFYSYLYSLSILFLLYVYVYLLKGVPASELRSKEKKYKKDRISETEKSHGSIFLRIGAVGFGLGSMVYNGLEFGSFFEIPYNSPCYSLLLGVNPVLQSTFTFAQMYFIFTYSRLMIHKFKLIARIGLMHLVGTNICIWIRTLGKETLQELKTTNNSNSLIEEIFLPMRSYQTVNIETSNITANFHNLLNKHYINKTNPCEKENIMGSILSDTSPYLYPFIVEYSLIGAAFLYVMWSNIGRINNYYHGQYTQTRNISNQTPNINHHYPLLHHHSKQRHHLHHHSNHQLASPSSTIQASVLNHNTLNQVNKSGSVSPTLSIQHQSNNIVTDSNNSRTFNTTSNEILDLNNSPNCSPTNQTINTSITTSPTKNVIVTKIQTTPPSNRKIIMVDYNNKNNNINTSTNANYTSNILALDNISTGSSYDSFNAKYTYVSNNGSHSPCKEHNLQSMYHRGHLMNSTQSLYSCLGSSKGLFCGFLFLVISITSLIIFFVLVHHTNYHLTATLISEISHSLLLVLSSIATIAAFFKIRKLKFQPGIHDTADGGLRDLLLKVAAFGLYVYSLFGVIAAALKLDSLQNVAVLITSSLTIIQVTLQSLFISDVICRKRSSSKQPGRQIITFLLIANLTLWIIYTFEMQKVEASPVQLRVYGFNRWALIVRITLPLSIFYRFHSAITFAEVWKNSYK